MAYELWRKKLFLMKNNTRTKRWISELDKNCLQIEHSAYHVYSATGAPNNYHLEYADNLFNPVQLDEIVKAEQSRDNLLLQNEKLLYDVNTNINIKVQSLPTTRQSNILQYCTERIGLISSNILQEIKTSRKRMLKEDHAAEIERTSKFYHNFTNAVLTTEEEKVLQKSAGYVLNDLEKGTQASLPSYLKDVTLEILLNYCKEVCGESKKKMNAKLSRGNVKRNIFRYFSHPSMSLKDIEFITQALDELTSFLSGYKPPNLETKAEDQIALLRATNNLKNRNDILVRESDKKLGWSVNTTDWYIKEYKRQLECTNYTKIEPFAENTIAMVDSLISKYSEKLRTIIQTQGSQSVLTTKETQYLLSFNNRKITIPYMNIMPKVHKLNGAASTELEASLKGRPIITAHSWCTVELSKYLQTQLRDILTRFKEYMQTLGLQLPPIRGTNQYILDVDNLTFNNLEGYFFVTYDFKDLYTNILYDSVESSLITICSILGISKCRCNFLLSLYKLYCEYNYFRVGNDIYKQVQGISMGGYCSGEICDLVLLDSEYQFLLTISEKDGLLLLRRYIDDGSLIMQTLAITELLDLLKRLFLFYPRNLEITVEIGRYNYTFLDQTYAVDDLSMQDSKIHRTVYFKPYHTFSYISPQSNHSLQIFRQVIRNESIRYARICTNSEDYSHVCNLLRIRMAKLGYTRAMVRNNVVNYDDICRSTLQYRGKRERMANRENAFMMAKVIFDKRVRADRHIRRIINRASIKSGANVRSKIVNSLQPKLRELLSTRRILHNVL